MADVKFTKSQQEAINIHGKNLLISAAAGSGKTATLTERIIRSITDSDSKIDITRLLIVTFTKAAAAELRERITAALSKELEKDPFNQRISRQLINIGQAQISTVDGFCRSVISKYYRKFGLPSDFKVGNDAELQLMRKNIMNDLVDKFYDSSDNEDFDFIALADCFTGARTDENLPDIFLKLYNNLISNPRSIELLKDSYEYLSNSNSHDFFELTSDRLTFGEIIRQDILRNFKKIESIFSAALDCMETDEKVKKAYYTPFEYDYNFIKGACATLELYNYNKFKEYLSSYSPIKLGRLSAENKTEEIEFFQNFRSKIFSKYIKDISKEYFNVSDDEFKQSISDTAYICKQLYIMLKEFEKEFSKAKKSAGICDFNDLEHFTLQLLYDKDGNRTPEAQEISELYDEIYIDEYQDTNRVQDKIFAAVSNGKNRFMVGDIKQSIYKFRGAEPAIFAEYRNAFPIINSENNNTDDGVSIFMSENFRCDRNIIDFVNAVSNHTFGNTYSIPYTDEDDLICAKNSPDENYISPKTEIYLIDKSQKNSENQFNGAQEFNENSEETDNSEISDVSTREADFVAQKIEDLLKSGVKSDGTRIRPCDIAILLRSANVNAKVFADALKRRGIGNINSASADFFESAEIMLVMCLLNCIDNPLRDVFLAGALRSPFFGFTMNDLLTIRRRFIDGPIYYAVRNYAEIQADDENNIDFDLNLAKKCDVFLKKLAEYREEARSAPTDELIRFLYKDTGIFAMIKEDNRRRNLTLLYEYARGYESGSFRGLYSFIKYVDGIIKNGNKIESAADTGDEENRVKIMSIHQSKGLEFPVCFLCDTARKFNISDKKSDVIFSDTLGIAMKIRHSDEIAKRDTLLRLSAAEYIEKSQKDEELRVLYVALTRARERLIITASLKEPDKEIEKLRQSREFICEQSIYDANNFIELILGTVTSKDCSKFSDVNIISPEMNIYPANIENQNSGITELETGNSYDENEFKRTEELLRSRLEYKYPYDYLRNLPAKLTVSRLSPAVLDEYNDIGDDISPEKIEKDEQKTKLIERPKFMSADADSPSAAEIGTATHLFMQFADFENAEKNGIENELARLVNSAFITADIAKIVKINYLRNFLKSNLYYEIKNAKRIIREFRFNVYLPSSEFTQNEELKEKLKSEELLVQGVIDCLFITADDRAVLVDYKTDFLTRAEIENKSLAAKKLLERHSRQLMYYKKACELILERQIDETYIYSLPLGDTIEVIF